jgi:hypothetical protein
MTHTKDEALEALILKAGINPVMQGSCYVMHPEALQAVIDEAIKQALEQPVQEPDAASLFREALGFGWIYGPLIPAHQWNEMCEEKVAQLVARLATPPAQPCQTCEALARTVMMDQTGRDA